MTENSLAEVATAQDGITLPEYSAEQSLIYVETEHSEAGETWGDTPDHGIAPHRDVPPGERCLMAPEFEKMTNGWTGGKYLRMARYFAGFARQLEMRGKIALQDHERSTDDPMEFSKITATAN